jgi:hypothetical protein
MKSKYVIAVLTLLGLGVVSTLAFSLGDLSSSSVAGPVQVTQGSTSEHLDTVDVYPYLGADGMYIKISLTEASGGITLDLTIEDSSNPIDISSYTYYYKTDGSWTQISSPTYDSDLGAVTLPMTGTSFSTIKLRISSASSSIYTNAETLIIYETAWS